MTESIASRVGRLISGTVNKLVDSAENMAPEVVMEQAIREMDAAIDDVRAELGRVLARKHLATTRLAEEGRKHEALSDKIRLAVEQGRDDLAEPAVAQLLDVEAQIPVLERTIAEARDAETELEGYVTALRGRQREMLDELKQFRAAQKQSAGEGGGADGAPGSAVDQAIERAERTFARVMDGAGGVGGTGAAPDRETAAKLAELDELQRRNRIHERLSAFKAGGED